MSKTVRGERRKALLIEGLTLVEVMVGMLISAICLGTALQAYFGAVSLRSKSQQLNTAIARMEADAETIRQLSKECSDPPDSEDTDCKDSENLAKVCKKGDYAQTLMNKVVRQDKVSTDQQSTESSQKATLPSPELSQDYKLRRTMEISSVTPNVLKVSYALTRSSHSAAQQTLESVVSANQESAEAESQKTLAQLSLAVMPNAALLCP
jgi:type II secretory pathway pseudopilin PulG